MFFKGGVEERGCDGGVGGKRREGGRREGGEDVCV